MSTQTRNLTDEQRSAITTTEVSVGLSAGAGCGKTFVLTERFLANLGPESGRDPLRRIVAITFTEAAAREMRNRIRAACRERLVTANEEDVEHWLGILRGLDSARITTIHGFCGSVLRRYAVEANIDPQFQQLDKTSGDAFVRRLVSDRTRQLLAASSEACLQLTARSDLARLQDILLALLSQRFRLEQDQFQNLTVEELANRYRHFWWTQYVPARLHELGEHPDVQPLLTLLQQHEIDIKRMVERRQNLLELLPEITNPEGAADRLPAIAENSTVQYATSKAAWPSEQLYEEIKERMKNVREEITKRVLPQTFDVTDADFHTAATDALLLLELAEDIISTYEREKRDHGVLDFDDLLIETRNLLRSREDVRRDLGHHLRLLMIDEFQDTDPVQTEIVRLLCGEELLDGKLFFVGDAKQSIYRFRRADPQVFHTLRHELPSEGRLPLTTNFRSQKAILDFVNAVFQREMGTSYEPLRPFDGKQLSPQPCIEFLFSEVTEDDVVESMQALKEEEQLELAATAEPGGDDQDGDETDSGDLESGKATSRRRTIKARDLRYEEARRVARRIRELLDDPTPRVRGPRDPATGNPTLRRVAPGDIAVLFRALSNIDLYESALHNENVDYYLVGGKAFYAQQEIYDVVNLCQAIDDPEDAISLAGVLRSPFFNLTDDALFAVSAGKTVTTALFEPPPEYLPTEDAERIRFAAETLSELRSIKSRLGISDLLQRAIDRTGYDAALVLQFLGERKLANLRKVVEMARQFDQDEGLSLWDFVRRMRDFITTEADEELAATSSETSDVVRLMTIHRSKGLEFPVVILADMNRKHGHPETKPVLHPDFGPLVRIPQADQSKPLHPALIMHQYAERKADLEEYTRLLYVALTRAADHLILSAAWDASQGPTSPWLQLLARRFSLSTGLPVDDPLLGVAALGVSDPDDIPQVLVHRVQSPGGQHRKAEQAHRIRLENLRSEILAATPVDIPISATPILPDHTRQGRFSVSQLMAADTLLQHPQQQSLGKAHPADLWSENEPANPWTESEPNTNTGLPGRNGVSAELGSLVHRVLEHVDLRQPDHWRELLTDFASEYAAHPALGELQSAAKCRLEAFFTTEYAAELARAKSIHRELEFLFEFSAVPPATIGGIIDCLFETADGQWMLLDYKTGQMTADAQQRYSLQVGIYALAVETISGQAPTRVDLIFLGSDVRSVPIETREDFLQESRERLTRAINAIRTS